jgi:hypothetical protein
MADDPYTKENRCIWQSRHIRLKMTHIRNYPRHIRSPPIYDVTQTTKAAILRSVRAIRTPLPTWFAIATYQYCEVSSNEQKSLLTCIITHLHR